MSTPGWVDGYNVQQVDNRPGLPFREKVPFRFTIHSTEGQTIESALGMYRSGTGPPHFTVEYGRDLKYQHVNLSLGAYALRNDAGGVQTNAIPNIQIEWVGFAKNGYKKTEQELQWFAAVLADIANAARDIGLIPDTFQLVWPEFYDDRSGFTLARKTAQQRVLNAEWDSGRWTLYGHQHVPENTHWDPGKIDWQIVDRKFRTLFPKVATVPPEPPTKNMHPLTEFEWQRLKQNDANLRERDANMRARIMKLEAAVAVLTEQVDGATNTDLALDIAELDEVLMGILVRVNDVERFQAAVKQAALDEIE